MLGSELDLRQRAACHRPELSTYPEALTASGIATWRQRMVNEYVSSGVFVELSAHLADTGFDDDLVRECLAFADEERHHGVLCGAVVEALGGAAAAPLPGERAFPRHTDAPGRAAVLRNVISVCCMSETVAVSLISAERLEMPEGPLRVLLTRIYADEVGHARFGWRLLACVADSLDRRERAAIERYLPLAFSHLEAHELSHLPDRAAPDGGAALGLCSGTDARALFQDTVDAVIRPGLRRWFRC